MSIPARVFDGENRRSENRPLIRDDVITPLSPTPKRKQWIIILGAVVLVSAIILLIGPKKSVVTSHTTTSDIENDNHNNNNNVDERKGDDESVVSSVMYRPYCTTYGTKYTNIKILQTSKGEPSQAWAPVLCEAADPKDSNTHHRRLWGKQASNTPPSVEKFGAPDAVLQVNLSQIAHPQRAVPILGFGGAFTEAAALNYQSLTQTGKDTVMELLFGKSGLGYSLGRVHINSIDFSIQSYSFDDTDGDFKLDDFDVGVHHDVATGMVDMALRAASVFRDAWGTSSSSSSSNTSAADVADGELQLFASPWSPPPWMKAPTPDDRSDAVHAENMTNSAQPVCIRDGAGPDSRYAKAWALYFSKFIDAYDALGLSFFAVTVQNEPEFPAPWEACSYTPETQAQFIAHHLGPQLRSDHPDVKILIFDHNKDHVDRWAQYILNTTRSYDASAQYVNGTAYHWYAGGMDRLLDGAVGTPNLHRLQTTLKESLPRAQREDHIVLGSEACHCPTTGYSGGDLEIYWSRAERYAHAILGDLAAGSNGWLEWNFILDSIGGPNHLKNLCDASILAVPHRAKGAGGIPPILDFEHAGHPFGPNHGDGRTREELNALGFPAEFVDAGVIVQPLYYYMGHISRHVRPGSRAVMAIADHIHCNGTTERTFRPKGQVVAGGGMNDLAREGIEVTVWPCEGSTRQQWQWNAKKQIEVHGHDWLGKPTRSCLSNYVNEDYLGLVTTSCSTSDAGKFDIAPVSSSSSSHVHIRLLASNSSSTKSSSECLVVKELENDGGANGPRGGAQATLGRCSGAAARWIWNEEYGEIFSTYYSSEGGNSTEGSCQDVCLTTGWPFLQVGAFNTTPNGNADNTVVVLNEAKDSANYILRDGADIVLSGSIPPRSIQTVLLS